MMHGIQALAFEPVDLGFQHCPELLLLWTVFILLLLLLRSRLADGSLVIVPVVAVAAHGSRFQRLRQQHQRLWL